MMRYLRDNTDLQIAETDEEVMKANNDVWPDDEYKNSVLVPKTTSEILNRPSVVYFASYIPTGLLEKAKAKGFKVAVITVPVEELKKRNDRRMKIEGYADVSQWFKGQLDNFSDLSKLNLIDQSIDGDRKTEEIARDVINFAKPGSGKIIS